MPPVHYADHAWWVTQRRIDGEAQWTVDGACTLTPLMPRVPGYWRGTVGDSVVTVACDADLGSWRRAAR